MGLDDGLEGIAALACERNGLHCVGVLEIRDTFFAEAFCVELQEDYELHLHREAIVYYRVAYITVIERALISISKT